jgi:hypothetical protein
MEASHSSKISVNFYWTTPEYGTFQQLSLIVTIIMEPPFSDPRFKDLPRLTSSFSEWKSIISEISKYSRAVAE